MIDMKRTKTFGLWLGLSILFLSISMAMLFCPACDKVEPLNKAESEFVGTWVLDDIVYTDYSGTDIKIYSYPSSSSFDSLCELYLNKTEIIFYESKKDGEISGILHIGNQKYDFSWYGWILNENVFRADFVKTFKLLTYFPKNNGTPSVTISYALIMDDGKLYINPIPNMTYVFIKQKNYNRY